MSESGGRDSHVFMLHDVCRTWIGVRCLSSGFESNAVESAMDCLVLFHAVSARNRQSGVKLIHLPWFVCLFRIIAKATCTTTYRPYVFRLEPRDPLFLPARNP